MTRPLILLMLNGLLAVSLVVGWGSPSAAAIGLTSVVLAVIGLNLLTILTLSGFELDRQYVDARMRGGIFGPLGWALNATTRLRNALLIGALLGGSIAALALLLDVDPALTFVTLAPLPLAAAITLGVIEADRTQPRDEGPQRARMKAMGIWAGAWVVGSFVALEVYDSLRTHNTWILRGITLAAVGAASVSLARSSVTIPRIRARGEAPPPEPYVPIDLGVRDLITVITPVRAGMDARNVADIWQSDGPLSLTNIRWVPVVDANDQHFPQALADALGERLEDRADLRRIQVVFTSQEGAAVKRNAGLEEPTTDFVGFVDADDYVDPDAVRRALELVLKSHNSYGAVHGFPYWLDADDSRLLRTPTRETRSLLTNHHCARIYPREVFSVIGLRYRPYAREDALFLLELLDLIPQLVHRDAKAAFLSYVDHSNDTNRLTRAKNVDTAAYLNRLLDASSGRSEHTDESLSPDVDPDRQEAVLQLFWQRTGYELAAGNSSRAAVEEMLGLMSGASLKTTFPLLPEIEAQVEGVTGRLGTAAADAPLRRAIPPFLATRHAFGRHLGKEHVKQDSSPTRSDPILTLALDLARHRGKAATERGGHRRSNELEIEVRVGSESSQHFEAYERRLVEHFLADLPHSSEIRRAPGNEDEMRVTVSAPSTGPTREPIADIDLHEQYASSKLLRLWGDVNPEHGPLESERAGAFADALRLYGEWSVVRVYGTGPSAERLAQEGASSSVGLGIACNSMVRKPDLLDALNVRIVAAADPIFHAGPSPYADQFRADLTSWLRQREDHVFVTVGRDIHIYLRELPGDVHHQVLAFDFTLRREDEPTSIQTLRTGTVRPHTNILTLLTLPLAANISRHRVHLTGFDGAPPDESKRFWRYSKSLNYSEDLQETVREFHPGFFRLDLPAYRASHSDMLGAMINEVTDLGLTVTSDSESFIPALQSVDVMNDLHESR